MMLYPSGCLNPITLHICLIMFTGRTNAWHIASRVSGFVRAGLTALPPVIQPRCDSLRYTVLAGEFSPVSPFNAQQLIFKGYQRY